MSVPLSGKILTAEVAELADALASGASGSNLIGVQIPTSAPDFARKTRERASSRQANIERRISEVCLAAAAQPRRRTTLAQRLLGFLPFKAE